MDQEEFQKKAIDIYVRIKQMDRDMLNVHRHYLDAIFREYPTDEFSSHSDSSLSEDSESNIQKINEQNEKSGLQINDIEDARFDN